MILKAETIWAGRGRTIHNGAVRIVDGTVAEIAPFEEVDTASDRVQDLGSAILLPAFINAHTHLDLSHLKGKTERGARFGRWLAGVAKARALMFFEGRSVRRGIGETIAGGAVAVGDVSTSGKSAALLRKHGLSNSIVFCETFGFDPADARRKADRLREVIEDARHRGALRLGISPHAAYSVSADLFQNCARLAEELSLPMAIHAAEAAAEVSFLTSGTGELRDLLERFGMLPKGWRPPGKRPIHYLDDLGVLKGKPLLIHCCQVDESEAAVIAARGCPVVYCARSNAFFRRPEDPLLLLLNAGVAVALGTDSLASNDSLSMLDEVRFVRQRHPDLDWELILEMATAHAARALNIENGGVVAKGGPADLTALRSAGGRDLPGRVFNENTSVMFTMHAGQRLRKPLASGSVLLER